MSEAATLERAGGQVAVHDVLSSALLRPAAAVEPAAQPAARRAAATMTLIGLAGYGGSGKNTAADQLVAAGWEQRSYADKIRQFMLAADLYLPDGRLWREVFHAVGYDTAKATVPGFRDLMVTVGDTLRNVVGSTVWVDACLACLPVNGRTVITDVRYPNEIDGIRDRGGVIVWIDRPGVGPALGTDGQPLISETLIGPDDADHVLINDGPPERLGRLLHAVASIADSVAA